MAQAPQATGNGDDQPGVPLAERTTQPWRPPTKPLADDRRPSQPRPKEDHPDEPQERPHDEQALEDHTTDDEKSKDEGPPFYKRPVPLIIIGAVLVLAIVAGILYWLHARKHESTDDAFIDGHIIQVAPKVSGQIKRVLIDDNQDVTAGQLLVEIDDRDYAANLAQAQASLASAVTKKQQSETNLELVRKNTAAQLVQAEAAVKVAQAAVATAESQAASAKADVVAAEAAAKRAEEDLNRYKSLDPRAVGQQTIDQATADARTTAANLAAARTKATAAESGITEAQARVAQARGGLDAAKAALAQVDVAKAEAASAAAEVQRAQAVADRAKLDVEYTRIVAPRAGRVTRRTAEPGAYVAVDGALLAIVEPDVWVTANFKETQLKKMKPGQKVTIKVDAYKDHTFTGKVDSIQQGTGARFSLLPPENATGNYVKVVQRVPVKIVFDPAPDRLLGPGMSVVPDVQVAE